MTNNPELQPNPDRLASSSPAPADDAPPLVLRDASKSYGVVRALRSASLELRRGEVHALVGENGSGKSTAVGIISGTVRPDSGVVIVGGTPCSHHTPWESQRLGALTVFQDGSVIQDLTVAQNLYLGTPAADQPPYRRMSAWAAERLRSFGLERLPVGARADMLSAGDRQLLEIGRALMARPKVLLLDEATSALDSAGIDIAVGMMRQAADDGAAVLFVTHRLSEVYRVADRISVLRDGVWQGTYDREAVDADRLVELMAGTSVDVEFPERASEVGEEVLVARGLRGAGYGPVDVTVRRGEIVGIAGADGNGQLELLRGLGALDAPDGSLEVKGSPVTGYGEAVGAGVVLLSGDRRNESLFPSLAIRENLVVGELSGLARLGLISRSAERHQVGESIRRFGIRLGSPEDLITSLSGGNQQKVALGRVLATEPDVLLVDEPTRGVDVRSRIDIYHMLRESAERGLAVVFVSSDASELAGVCDRIIVLSRGAIVAELPGQTATEERIVGSFVRAETVLVPADGPSGDSVARAERPPGRLAQMIRAHEDASRFLLLFVLLLALGGYTQSQNSTFLTVLGLNNLLLVALPLAAIAGAEFVALFAGGIDVSVGGVMGVMVVLMSYAVQSGSFIVGLAISAGIAVGLGVIVGSINATLIERIRISPVIATIATLGALQGLGLLLRSTPGGTISPSLTTGLGDRVWIFPAPLLVVAGLFLIADRFMRSSGFGLRVRAVGLSPQFAYRLGINAPLLRYVSYIGCSVLAGLAGVLLGGQVGTGDSTVGNQFILLAIAAPILGGASLLGGRGAFIGCMLGGVLLATAQTLPTTLSLNPAAGFYLTGGLTLIALLVYTSGVTTQLRTSVRTVRRRLAKVSWGS